MMGKRKRCLCGSINKRRKRMIVYIIILALCVWGPLCEGHERSGHFGVLVIVRDQRARR
jgi:hypothetical protein